MPNSSTATSASPHWLDILEILSVVGSVGGSVASFLANQVIFASIPLTVAVGLNLANRRRHIDAGFLKTQASIAEQQTLIHKSEQKFGQLVGSAQGSIQTLEQHLHQSDDVVKCLRAIKNYTQSIQGVSKEDDQTYYLRGLAHHRLGDIQEAIEDYSQAIDLNSNHAKAFFNRGVASARLGDKQQAVQDLRSAAKFFFEQGDLERYRKARDMSKDLHSTAPLDDSVEVADPIEESEDSLVLEGLFA